MTERVTVCRAAWSAHRAVGNPLRFRLETVVRVLATGRWSHRNRAGDMRAVLHAVTEQLKKAQAA